jgi:hypothetical protein
VAKLARADQWITRGPVRYRVFGPQHSPAGLEFGVDWGKAPVPEHFYVADYLFVAQEGSQVLLTFGKLDRPARDRLRTKLEIYFGPAMFVRQLWASSRELHETVRKYVEKRGHHADPWPQLLEAPKVQTFQSNQVMMALSEGECVLDFFYLSPKDMFLRPRAGEAVDLEPVVRVLLAPELLLLFLDRCEPVAEALGSSFSVKAFEEAHADLESE